MSLVSFYTPGLLMFSGCIERDSDIKWNNVPNIGIHENKLPRVQLKMAALLKNENGQVRVTFLVNPLFSPSNISLRLSP